MNIIINSFGIQDSGGITVLARLLSEIENSSYEFIIICNKNENILNLVDKYKKNKNFEFKIIQKKYLIYRLYFENIIFRKIMKEKDVKLIYNFSGTAQYFSFVPQITKVHNLLFYSKKIDKEYFGKKQYILWFKQIFLKKIVFHSMLKQTQYIEVQSEHVKEYISDFIDVSKKQFFLKSDIDIDIKNKLSQKIQEYNFSKKLRFLYIVGPHFESLHKNFQDFVGTMKIFKENKTNFEIVITLTKEQLNNSNIWDNSLDENTNFLGYISKENLMKEFQSNTILISTSVIETIGLHVIEAIQNGIIVVVPDEKYSLNVYGKDILTYELFNVDDLANTIQNIILLSNNEIKDIISKNRRYLIENENTKYQNIVDIFEQIIKDKNV